MLRTVLLVAGLLTALAGRRRLVAQRAERDLWREAGVAPDLR